MAVAVADMRASRRHNEVMGRFDARSSYHDRLSAMPPAAREVLVEDQVHPASAEKLVYAVTEGEPRVIIGAHITDHH